MKKETSKVSVLSGIMFSTHWAVFLGTHYIILLSYQDIIKNQSMINLIPLHILF